jgi:hypothetical protein
MNTSAKTSDLIPHNGRFTTLNRANPTANAAVIKDGKFIAVGRNPDIEQQVGKSVELIPALSEPRNLFGELGLQRTQRACLALE